MSASSFGQSKAGKRLCQRCRDRKARFAYRGRVKADRDHTLCFECYRGERDRQRQRALPFMNPAPSRTSESHPSSIEHRRLMLEHLTRRRAEEAKSHVLSITMVHGTCAKTAARRRMT